MRTVLDIAALTIRETQRRRILWVALFMGLAFLALFVLGFYFLFREFQREVVVGGSMDATIVTFLRMAGLYAVNFLSIAMAALISANTISGEVESHTVETIVTKPIPRWTVIGGKWCGLAVVITLYTFLMAGGVILIVYLFSGYTIENPLASLGLMALSPLTMLSVSILGGTRLSTLANGALAFMLYGIAFLGGWVEQIGALLRNETAVDLGILSSLLMPADVIWKKTATLMQSADVTNVNLAGPLVIASQPHDRVILYGIVYSLVLLLVAMWSFARRDL